MTNLVCFTESVQMCTPMVRQHNDMTIDDFTIYHYRELCDVFDVINTRLLNDKGEWVDFVRFCYQNSSLHKPKSLAQVRQDWYQENVQ